MAELVYSGIILTQGGGSTNTRPIFWLDILILVVVMFLVIAQQWDYVLALAIALVMMNYFHRTMSKRQ